MTARISGDNAANRNANGTFAKGNSGKPIGTRNRATQAILGLLVDATGRLTKGAKFDTAALRLCIERIFAEAFSG